MNKPPYSLGALPDPVDYRDIKYSAISLGSITKFPKSKIIDISSSPVKDQKHQPSCVGHAEGLVVEAQNNINLSNRWLYGVCKLHDGYSGEGTYPRVGSSVLKEYGIPTTKTHDNNHDMAKSEFIKINISEKVLADAEKNRIDGFAVLEHGTMLPIKQAINDGKLVTISLPVDWSAGWRKGSEISAPKNISGRHRVVIFGYDDDTFFFRNSWGKKWGKDGNGSFKFSDYESYFLDARVYTFIPQNIIDDAKAKPYVFTNTLKRGSRGYEVEKLQEKLKISPVDGSFGNMTHTAVILFQRENGLVSDGVVGGKTRDALNKDTGSKGPVKVTATLEAFADAIQDMEGYFPGSRSYRNNNPFNLKYIGQKTALRQDEKGFCVFPDYKTGREAGLDQIRRVMRNGSKDYKKDCTFLEFFNTYAPSNDNNNPNRYATYVGQKLGVGVDYKVKDLII